MYSDFQIVNPDHKKQLHQLEYSTYVQFLLYLDLTLSLISKCNLGQQPCIPLCLVKWCYPSMIVILFCHGLPIGVHDHPMHSYEDLHFVLWSSIGFDKCIYLCIHNHCIIE